MAETSNKTGAFSQVAQSDAVQAMGKWARMTAVMSLVGLALAIVQNEIAWAANTSAGIFGAFCPSAADLSCDPRAGAQMLPVVSAKVPVQILCGLVSVTTVMALVSLTALYRNKLRYMQARNRLPPSASILSSSALRWGFLGEACLLAVHVFPGCDGLTEGSPVLYLLLTQLMWLRLYTLVRVLAFGSRLMSGNGRFISALTRVDFSLSFMMKNEVKTRPLAYLTAALALTLFATSYALRMTETLLCAADYSLGCFPLTFGDAMWVMVVTMLTIGYGDRVAHTTGA